MLHTSCVICPLSPVYPLIKRYGPDDERVARTIEKLRPVDSPESSVEEADLDYEEEELRRALIDAEATAANDAGRRAANLHGEIPPPPPLFQCVA